jgi:hypothetical protein
VYLGAEVSLVKGCAAPKTEVQLGIVFLGRRDNQATFLPECAATLPSVNGEVTVPGTVWLTTAEGDLKDQDIPPI